MKHLMRIIPLLCVLLVSCGTSPPVVRHDLRARAAPAARRMLVVCHGWHTGLIVDARDARAALPWLAPRFPQAEYLEIGWGDAGFYRAQEITTGLSLRAMFASPGSVLHVVGFRGAPQANFPASRMLAVPLDAVRWDGVSRYLRGSFAIGPDGRVARLGRGLYGDSEFYPAVGRYSLCNTCNKWTAKAVASTGAEIGTAWTLRASGVMADVARMAR